MDNKIIGKNIRKERQNQNITIEELANMSNITSNFLGKIERGQATMSLATFIQIVNALNVSADELLKGNLDSINLDSLYKQNDKFNNMSKDDQIDLYEIIKLIENYYLNK